MKRRGFIPINSPQFFDIVAALVSDEFRLPMPYASVVVANALLAEFETIFLYIWRQSMLIRSIEIVTIGITLRKRQNILVIA